MIDIRHYIYFIAVAETGSFSQAAEKCCLTQGTVSHQIKMLEEYMGTPLFIRSTRSLSLTEAGQELLPLARLVICANENCKDRIMSMNKGLNGELRIGVGAFIEPYMRHAAIRMMNEYPGVRLVFCYGKASFLNRLLCNHELDIAFTLNTAYDSENIESIPCASVYLKVIMPKGHPLSQYKDVTFDNALKYGVVMPDIGSRVYNSIQQYADVKLSRLRVRTVVNDAEAALNMVEDANLITFLPESYIKHRHDLVSRPIHELTRPLITNAHWLQDACHKYTARLFLKYVQEDGKYSTLPEFD